MFEKLTEQIGNKIEDIGNTIQEAIQNRSQSFSTTQFDDPIADKTDWGPCRSGGTNFRTHKLVPEMRGIMRFKATLGALMFGFVFMAAGLGSGVVMIGETLSGSNPPPIFIAIIVPIVFGGAGFYLLRSFMTPIVFSINKGYFWKGYMKEHEDPEHKGLKTYCRILDIHALQVISEYCKSDKSPYRSYEINIVKKDGSRLNVVDYGNRHKIREDAQKLATYLRVPLWDGSR
jgi:hypothetical protein